MLLATVEVSLRFTFAVASPSGTSKLRSILSAPVISGSMLLTLTNEKASFFRFISILLNFECFISFNNKVIGGILDGEIRLDLNHYFEVLLMLFCILSLWT